MDRVGADFDRCLAMIRDRLTKRAFPIQLPVGSGELFTGHIDVLRRVEVVFDDATLGKSYTEIGHITAGMPLIQAEVAAGETDADPTNAPGDGTPKTTFTSFRVESYDAIPSWSSLGVTVTMLPAMSPYHLYIQ